MNTKKTIINLLHLLVIGVVLTPNLSVLNAQALDQTHIFLDKSTIAKGYTVSGFNDKLKLSLVPGILSESTDIDMQVIGDKMPEPFKLNRISEILQFEFKNKAAYDNHKPFYIQFSYNQEDDGYKQVFFFDKTYGTWRPLPTRDFPDENFVRSLIHLPYARIAVFSYPNTLSNGPASWYAYKPGNYAASPDFPKGSKLRVYNIETGAKVDVEVNDYGPDRSVHPDRPIDLEKNAFMQIAPLGQGVAHVVVEPLYVPADEQNNIMGIPADGINGEPVITAKSGMVYNADTGSIIWQKNAEQSLPIASLTKLVAIKVFLDTNPDLNKVVSYQVKDEEYNYEWCKTWESTKLKLVEGETLTIKDLVYTSLVGSTNNTIETLVRVSGLSRPEFIAEMNRLATNLGAGSTKFIEPTGLAPENVSSAHDFALMTKNILADKTISQASTMVEYSFTTINQAVDHRIRNTNNLIALNKLSYVISKTGYLDEAGHCLMTAIKTSDGQTLIAVILGADEKLTSRTENQDLLLYAINKIK